MEGHYAPTSIATRCVSAFSSSLCSPPPVDYLCSPAISSAAARTPITVLGFGFLAASALPFAGSSSPQPKKETNSTVRSAQPTISQWCMWIRTFCPRRSVSLSIRVRGRRSHVIDPLPLCQEQADDIESDVGDLVKEAGERLNGLGFSRAAVFCGCGKQ